MPQADEPLNASDRSPDAAHHLSERAVTAAGSAGIGAHHRGGLLATRGRFFQYPTVKRCR